MAAKPARNIKAGLEAVFSGGAVVGVNKDRAHGWSPVERRVRHDGVTGQALNALDTVSGPYSLTWVKTRPGAASLPVAACAAQS
jgi:hypothetical protein